MMTDKAIGASDPIHCFNESLPCLSYLYLERRAPWYFLLSCAFNSASVLMLIASKTEDESQARSAQGLIALFMAYSILDGTSKTSHQAINFWTLYCCSFINLFNQMILTEGLGLPESWSTYEFAPSIILALVPSFFCDQDKRDQIRYILTCQWAQSWNNILQNPPVFLRMFKSVSSTIINAIFSMLQSDDPFTGQIFQIISGLFSLVFICSYLHINKQSSDYCVTWQPLLINFQQALNKKPLALFYKLAPFLLLVGLSLYFSNKHDLYQWPQNDFTAWSFLCLAIESMGMMCIIRKVDLESMKVELLCDSKSSDYVLLKTEGHQQEQMPHRGVLSCCYALFKRQAISVSEEQQGGLLVHSGC